MGEWVKNEIETIKSPTVYLNHDKYEENDLPDDGSHRSNDILRLYRWWQHIQRILMTSIMSFPQVRHQPAARAEVMLQASVSVHAPVQRRIAALWGRPNPWTVEGLNKYEHKKGATRLLFCLIPHKGSDPLCSSVRISWNRVSAYRNGGSLCCRSKPQQRKILPACWCHRAVRWSHR